MLELYPTNALELINTLDYHTLENVINIGIKYKNKQNNVNEENDNTNKVNNNNVNKNTVSDEERNKVNEALEKTLSDYNININDIRDKFFKGEYS